MSFVKIMFKHPYQIKDKFGKITLNPSTKELFYHYYSDKDLYNNELSILEKIKKIRENQQKARELLEKLEFSWYYKLLDKRRP